MHIKTGKLIKNFHIHARKIKVSLTRNCNILKFSINKAIINLTQDNLRQEESYVLKSHLHFSIQSEKLRQFGILTTFEKIYRSFINNLKLNATKRRVKDHLFYLANSYSFRYKPSPPVFCRYRVLSNLRRNINTIATKHNKGNAVVWKNIQEIKLWNLRFSCSSFYVNWTRINFLMKWTW